MRISILVETLCTVIHRVFIYVWKMKKRISNTEWVWADEIFSTTFLTIDLIRKYCEDSVWFDSWIAINIYLFYAKCASVQETKRVFAKTTFVAKGLWYSRDTIIKYRGILKEVWCIEDVEVREKWVIRWHYVKVNFAVVSTEARVGFEPESGQVDTNADINKLINTDEVKELNAVILSKDNNSNELIKEEKEENNNDRGIANNNNTDKANKLKEDVKNYFNNFDTTEQAILEIPEDFLDNSTKIDTAKKQKEEATIEDERDKIEQAIAKTKVKAKPKKTTTIPNRQIANFCKQEAKKHWFVCAASDNNWVQHFRSQQFKDLMEIGWCEDMFCMIAKLIEWNIKLWKYAYDISTPQKLYSNSTKIYNTLVKNWQRDEDNNPAKQWFEEFYNAYPKKEWRDQGESWYLTFVKKIESHNEIMKWTKVFVWTIEREGKALEYIKSAYRYLEDKARRDYLLDEIPDSSIRKQAYDMWDARMYAEHLKAKYWPDRPDKYWLDYSDLKQEIVEKWWVK